MEILIEQGSISGSLPAHQLTRVSYGEDWSQLGFREPDGNFWRLQENESLVFGPYDDKTGERKPFIDTDGIHCPLQTWKELRIDELLRAEASSAALSALVAAADEPKLDTSEKIKDSPANNIDPVSTNKVGESTDDNPTPMKRKKSSFLFWLVAGGLFLGE